MDPKTHFEKRRMNTTRMYRSYVLEKRQTLQECISWRISRFEKIKENICYTSRFDLYGWALSLTRRTKSLTVAVKTRLNNQRVECRIAGNKSHTLRKEAEECSEGTYQAKFQSDEGRDNIMENSGVEIIFVILKSAVPRCFPLISLERSSYDESGLFASMKNLYFSLPKLSSGEDFFIRGKNYVLPVHKAILSVRSKFFSNYFKECPNAEELKMYFNFLEMVAVLDFIYTGEVGLSGKLDFSLLIFQVAVSLGITGLQEMLVLYFRQIMGPENVTVIKSFANKIESEILKEAVNDFIKNVGLVRKF